MVTNLVFANVANENNEINQASIEEFCNANRTEAFVQAVGNSAGSLVDPQCAVQAMFAHVYSDEAVTITKGELQTGTINTMCSAEQNSEQNSEVISAELCNYTDPCAVINGGLSFEIVCYSKYLGGCSNDLCSIL